MAKCAGPFNKPQANFKRMAKTKTRDKKRLLGTAEKGKAASLRVSGLRTKKHARKSAHRAKMAELDEKNRQKELEQAALDVAEEDAKMSKPKNRRTKAQKKAAKRSREAAGSEPTPMQE